MLGGEFEVPWHVIAIILAVENRFEGTITMVLSSNTCLSNCYRCIKRSDKSKRRSVDLETSHKARASARLRLN